MAKRHFQKLLFICTILFIVGSCSEQTTEPTDLHTWQMYSGDPTGSKFSLLDQINVDNVDQLKPVWTYDTGDKRDRSIIECNPIIIGERMYVSTPGMKAVCLDARTGKEIWKFDPFENARVRGVNRGVVYCPMENGADQIFFVAGPRLYALHAETGEKISAFGDKGAVDLNAGLGRDVEGLWLTAATPGVIFDGLLILGSTLGEGPGRAAPGHIRAYDIKTGEQKWIFHTIPYPGEPGYETWSEDSWQHIGGTNAWGGFTIDMEREMIFCGTGSATYDHWGGNRIGQNLYANCILALDPRTGERIWHFQTVHHDIWDYDLPCPPNLVQVERNGVLIDAVAQPSKMGHLFVLDRETGEPVFPVEEVPVPQSDIPGEQTWPTQPFPHEGLRYAKQVFTKDDITTLSPASTASIEAFFEEKDYASIFTPPSEKGIVMLPQFNGGTDWGGAAYDPFERILYVNCSNEAEWISMIPAAPAEEVSQFHLGEHIFRGNCTQCHGFGKSNDPALLDIGQLRQRALELDDAAIIQQIREGRGQMPAFATLSDDEVQALVAFVRDTGHETQLQRSNLDLTFAGDVPWIATGHNVLKDAEGFPANKPPWGLVNAIDMDKGEILWQVPLGTYPELEARGLPPTGTFNMGGPLATAGGLIFIGASMDERFRAMDKSTGEVLWTYQMEAAGYATPATYELDGKQYVIIAGGGGGIPGTKSGDRYYCFAL